MGASKKLMEEAVLAYSTRIPAVTARFANVAFSNGSLPAGFLERITKGQPLSAPHDVRRYFVSPAESGELCLLACVLGAPGEIFFPELDEPRMLTFSTIADAYLRDLGYTPVPCASEDEARQAAASRSAEDSTWPVYYFASETSGEKPFEEFFTADEEVDHERFDSLGVIAGTHEQRCGEHPVDHHRPAHPVFPPRPSQGCDRRDPDQACPEFPARGDRQEPGCEDVTVSRFFKRFFDVLVAGVALLILTPLLLPVTIALKLTGEGEVFYKQKRIGYQNDNFNILKFATMLKNSPNMGTGSLTVRGDPRVTPLGHGLRATKVNELPQLINVLVGDMSFVGPRPQMQVDFDVYPQAVRERIYEVRPGVTGIGSIVFRDEERLLSREGIDPAPVLHREDRTL